MALLAAPVNVAAGAVVAAVVVRATTGVEVAVILEPLDEVVELEKDGTVVLEWATPVGTAQVMQATLAETVTGMTAVHGQSVMVTIVASVMVEVSEP